MATAPTGGASGRSWVAELENQVSDPNRQQDRWNNLSMYRVPDFIKEQNPKAYRPQVVSFGPYHHGADGVAAMEEHKFCALHHFLRRAKMPLGNLASGMEEIVGKLQSSYQGLDESWLGSDGREQFLRLMIVDGCFMIEILRLDHFLLQGVSGSSPTFCEHGIQHKMEYIKRDMLMLENQLPLLVLDKLFSLVPSEPAHSFPINPLVQEFCWSKYRAAVPGIDLAVHPLDRYRRSLIRDCLAPMPSYFNIVRGGGVIRSAVELYESGVRFKRSRTTSPNDISFQHGNLSLPVIVVDVSTQYIYLNLLAFERLHVRAGSEFSNFVVFMDRLIDSGKDVSFLRSNGIIRNALGSDEAVANLFNSMSKDVTLDPYSCLENVQGQLNAYCQKRWNVWRANLIQTYFRSPWAFLSLAAAVFLLVLSLLQTIYSALSYYRDGDSTSPPPPINPRRGL